MSLFGSEVECECLCHVDTNFQKLVLPDTISDDHDCDSKATC